MVEGDGMIEANRKPVYRDTPGCALGCDLCEVHCAVATRVRDDIAAELARAEAAVLAFRPKARATHH